MWSSQSPKAWKPGELIVWFPVWKLAGSRPEKSQYFCSHLKAGKGWCSAQVVRQEAFPFTQPVCSAQLIGWGPCTLERVVCFIQSPDTSIHLIQIHPHRHTQNNLWLHVWVPWGPVRLTHKINHHKLWPAEKDAGLTWPKPTVVYSPFDRIRCSH